MHSSLLFFRYIKNISILKSIFKIQTFENLIEPVVESIRFLSNLEYDILSFCLIEHLASPDKQQLKVFLNFSFWIKKKSFAINLVLKQVIFWLRLLMGLCHHGFSPLPLLLAMFSWDTIWNWQVCFNMWLISWKMEKGSL